MRQLIALEAEASLYVAKRVAGKAIVRVNA
jgi:hypothetical protein